MKTALSAFILSMAVALPATADTLLIEAIDAAKQTLPQGVKRPTRGASMASVYSRSGEPKSTLPAVGEPPITRWVYPEFTVYFEYDRVIDVVVHR